MKMAASGADWSKRLIKTRERRKKGASVSKDGTRGRGREQRRGERRRETSIDRAYNIIFIFRTKDVIS